jgi:hypothetical protein
VFGWLKGRRVHKASLDVVRELMFGDVPVAEWAGSGSAAVYDAAGADGEIDERVLAILAAGRKVTEVVGTWSGARPALAPGLARVTALTPAGLRFGEGPLDVLSRDPLAGPIFASGAALLQLLSQRARSDSAAPSAERRSARDKREVDNS